MITDFCLTFAGCRSKIRDPGRKISDGKVAAHGIILPDASHFAKGVHLTCALTHSYFAAVDDVVCCIDWLRDCFDGGIVSAT